MKRTFLLLLSSIVLALAGCGDKVSDPEALYQKYLKDDAVRQAKVKECNLLSADEQLKSQSCQIARKAAGQRGAEDFGRTLRSMGRKE